MCSTCTVNCSFYQIALVRFRYHFFSSESNIHNIRLKIHWTTAGKSCNWRNLIDIQKPQYGNSRKHHLKSTRTLNQEMCQGGSFLQEYHSRSLALHKEPKAFGQEQGALVMIGQSAELYCKGWNLARSHFAFLSKSRAHQEHNKYPYYITELFQYWQLSY